MLERTAVEDVIAQHEGDFIFADELATQHEGLGQSVGHLLHLVFEAASDAAAITQQPLEMRQVGGSGDDQYLTNPRRKQRRERIVNHRFVINGHQLFAHGQRNGMQSRASTAC